MPVRRTAWPSASSNSLRPGNVRQPVILLILSPALLGDRDPKAPHAAHERGQHLRLRHDLHILHEIDVQRKVRRARELRPGEQMEGVHQRMVSRSRWVHRASARLSVPACAHTRQRPQRAVREACHRNLEGCEAERGAIERGQAGGVPVSRW